ncbi:Arb2 domain-containing protein [Aspergillus uvarum CBS 121591]|uniref:Arb2 domain-containing protein n=1 Tax=Aspergillus uvarum CBS 121591 TaxID=1448315 RepID=A0A319CFD9_9EURO|nr:Arb2 domain-containing protein [Aspergillus uvarum CBS 121591]PYH83954.1 Arb2 domain-containing protein [Aspergillus uvarum CBS 121591]
MFVYRREDLPTDPVFPADLTELGYFVTDQDQIRKISDPTQEFQYKINRNCRWNDVQREAMNECIRKLVSARLRDLGLVNLHLPLRATTNEAHVPIMVSRNLSTASHIIVVFGEPIQDLGIWAYRSVGGDGIDAGSLVSFARAVLRQGQANGNSGNGDSDGDGDAADMPNTALVLANTGQLVWHCASGQAITLVHWQNMPRPSAVDPPPGMSLRNRIPGHEYWQRHVNRVFEDILSARGRLVRPDARISVVGASEGGLGALRYLNKHWSSWRPFISAICLANPLQLARIEFGSDYENAASADSTSFAAFVASRCRGYVLSDQPLGVPVEAMLDSGCNCYASGEGLNSECIMLKAWRHALGWLNQAFADPGYGEARLEIMHFDGGELDDTVEADGDDAVEANVAEDGERS